MRAQVQDVIDSIRPAVEADGAEVSLVHVAEDTGVVTIELHLPGEGCASSSAPLLAGVERIMKDRVGGVTSVVQPECSTVAASGGSGCATCVHRTAHQ